MPMSIGVGDKAPSFSALDQNGNEHKLADYKGKWLLLYFYPRDNTPGCTKEACGFRDLYSKLTKQMEIVGVSSNSVNSHANFAEKYSLPFTLLADPEKKVLDSYGANGIILAKRTSFLIDPNGKIAKIYKSVKPAEHPEQILKDFSAIKSSVGE